MTDSEIFEKLQGLLQSVLGVKADQIKPESVLVKDLGAESIDLLDLSFLIEDTFGITIEPNEFEKEVKARLPGGVFEKEGFLTDEALAELRQALPEVDQSRLVPGFRKAEIPSLLTVSVFVRLIRRKLDAKANQP
ncbi:MAG: Acyl carrier protein [Candidatus Ozemobacter sibiricus]|jgi:acyl carrier protein|uniref:Acyl carrier protein n=1 Tax=Candidatus Ozemobacter sibiricus TaxID=2268124 RepID=A0A367ZSL1_9BACT|nr:MAG: Acyl carrier protein [Candidatus Ozemobacter sibiricus]